MKEALFNQPVAVAAPGSGKFLLVADAGNNAVRKIDLETGKVSTFVDKETPFGWSGNPQVACARMTKIVPTPVPSTVKLVIAEPVPSLYVNCVPVLKP